MTARPDPDPSRVRLPGLARPEWGDEARPLLEAALGRVAGMLSEEGAAAGGAAGNPLPTLTLIAHHEPLLAPFLSWATALALDGPLSPRLAELVALRTAYRCGSRFEWEEHRAYGLSAGLSDAEIRAIATGPDDPIWGELDQALLQAADDLHTTATVSDATWAVLARHLSPAELVGVTLVSGQYRMLSGLANAAGVDHALDPPEPGSVALPEPGK